jgi:hypothetical protein
MPLAAYQFADCPSTPQALKKLASEIAKTVKTVLRLPKNFPACMIFHPDALGATEVETEYLQKSLADLLVASQPGLTSEHHAKTYISQLLWELCDPNSSVSDPVPLGTFGFLHPLANTSSLMAQYKLSLNDPLEPQLAQSSGLLGRPIHKCNLQALCHSGLCELSQYS